MGIPLHYLQLDADTYVRGDCIPLLEQIIVAKYHKVKSIPEELQKLRQDVSKCEGFISEEILNL